MSNNDEKFYNSMQQQQQYSQYYTPTYVYSTPMQMQHIQQYSYAYPVQSTEQAYSYSASLTPGTMMSKPGTTSSPPVSYVLAAGKGSNTTVTSIQSIQQPTQMTQQTSSTVRRESASQGNVAQRPVNQFNAYYTTNGSAMANINVANVSSSGISGVGGVAIGVGTGAMSTSSATATSASSASVTSFSKHATAKRDSSPPWYSIDVECVATGAQHNQRAVGQISLIDQYERIVLNLYVKPAQKIFSYLTKLSGLTEELISKQGIELDKAKELVKAALPKNAILVGQNILQDVQWLELQEGVDFGGLMDLAGVWRVYNEKYKGYSYFSLQHEAKALLGFSQTGPHNAVTDATLSIRLYNLYKRIEKDATQLSKAHQALLQTPIDPSFAKLNPVHDGVCMGQKKSCKCGAPFFF